MFACGVEHGSPEPNLIYHDGKWKMWYVAGANEDDYLVQGYSGSPDGSTGWSPHQIVFAPEKKVFDFCVVAAEGGYEAVFARANVSTADLPKTGLWWCRANEPSPDISGWSQPVRLTGPGPWKPVLRYGEIDPLRMFVFYGGSYPSVSKVGLPFNFTLNCLEIDRPACPNGTTGGGGSAPACG
jgi:hypothetical protein